MKSSVLDKGRQIAFVSRIKSADYCICVPEEIWKRSSSVPTDVIFIAFERSPVKLLVYGDRNGNDGYLDLAKFVRPEVVERVSGAFPSQSSGWRLGLAIRSQSFR